MMSKVTILDKLYAAPGLGISADKFDYNTLPAPPPIRSIFTQYDIDELYHIATSLKLSGNMNKKYEMINNIMKSRGFRLGHRGTNRITYTFLEDPTFVAKVAIDKAGLKDSPAEYKNQEYLKPFCCKIFEVDPSGVIAFIERVEPITSKEEFRAVSDDIFNLMFYWVIGRYVVDDLGAEKFMNYGLRILNGYAFGPVIIDYPYLYELDGGKLICKGINPITNMPCLGEIDYDAALSNLYCTRCGKKYTAQDLRKEDNTAVKLYYGGDSERGYKMRTRVVNGEGKVILDSGHVSSKNLTAEEMRQIQFVSNDQEITEVAKTYVIKCPRQTPLEANRKYYEEQRKKQMYYGNISEPFNPAMYDDPNVEIVEVRNSKRDKTIKAEEKDCVKPLDDGNCTRTEVISNKNHEDIIHKIIPELDNPPINQEVPNNEKPKDLNNEEENTRYASDNTELSEDYVDPTTAYFQNMKESSSDDNEEYDEYAEQFSNKLNKRNKPKGGKKYRPGYEDEDMSDY